MLIRLLIQPLHVMTRAMEDIADGDGDLTKRLTIQNQDEFGILGTAFNRFVARIHDSIREVSSATEHVNEVALRRSEEHTSELQSLMRISYAVFCLTKNN